MARANAMIPRANADQLGDGLAAFGDDDFLPRRRDAIHQLEAARFEFCRGQLHDHFNIVTCDDPSSDGPVYGAPASASIAESSARFGTRAISSRRFSWRPASVWLDATGWNCA